MSYSAMERRFEMLHNLQEGKEEADVLDFASSTMYSDNVRTEEAVTNGFNSSRIHKINAIGVVWKVRTCLWMKMYEELKSFQQQNKHTIVPVTVTTKQLAQWLEQKRCEYKAYMDMSRGPNTEKKIPSIEEGIRLLEQIPSFIWQTPLATSLWETHFQQLIEYKETFGDCNVPVPYKMKPELGEFVRTQRVLYKLKKEGIRAWWTLSYEQVDRLEEIGFSWLVAGGVEEGGLDRDVLNNLQEGGTHVIHSRSTSPSDVIATEDETITSHEGENMEEEQNPSQP
eukprot:8737710-Ditylum_brightwellii.AAC.1